MREADEAPGAVWADAVRRGVEERQEAVVVSVEDSGATAEDEVVDEEDSARAEAHPEDGARPGVEGVTDRCASFSRIPLLRMYIIFGLTTLDHRLRSAVNWVMSEDHGLTCWRIPLSRVSGLPFSCCLAPTTKRGHYKYNIRLDTIGI